MRLRYTCVFIKLLISVEMIPSFMPIFFFVWVQSLDWIGSLSQRPQETSKCFLPGQHQEMESRQFSGLKVFIRNVHPFINSLPTNSHSSFRNQRKWFYYFFLEKLCLTFCVRSCPSVTCVFTKYPTVFLCSTQYDSDKILNYIMLSYQPLRVEC